MAPDIAKTVGDNNWAAEEVAAGERRTLAPRALLPHLYWQAYGAGA
jgi:hypothetical protein